MKESYIIRRVVDPAVREDDERFERMMKMFCTMSPTERLKLEISAGLRNQDGSFRFLGDEKSLEEILSETEIIEEKRHPMNTDSPPETCILAAIAEANRSPCAKSKRGVVFFSINPTRIISRGHNAQPEPFLCDGSASCREACNRLCEHAESAALRKIDLHGAIGDLLHVKTIDGDLVPSGSPSCWQCSRAILADRRIDKVWLYHVDGWQSYTTLEFHAMTLKTCNLPVLRGDR